MKKTILFMLLFAVIISAQTKDTLTTESGLKYIILAKGNGPKAENNKSVEVHYTGSLLDGKVFDSSRERGEPIEFTLGTGQVIKGWDEGIALMNVGDQFRLIIPPGLAYGDKGAGNVIPPKSTLIFDVELVSVSDPKTPISEALFDYIIADSIQAAIDKYHDLKKNHFDEYSFKEMHLNQLGYQLLQVGRINAAMAVLKLNCETYPKSSNAWDSLGEACKVAGNKEEAIKNYERSLQLNPKNKNAEENLKLLKETK